MVLRIRSVIQLIPDLRASGIIVLWGFLLCNLLSALLLCKPDYFPTYLTQVLRPPDVDDAPSEVIRSQHHFVVGVTR